MADQHSKHLCDVCGNEFTRRLNKDGSIRKTKYQHCSESCKSRARVLRDNPNAEKRLQKPTLTCKHCGKSYINKRGNKTEGSFFCSRECAFEYRAKNRKPKFCVVYAMYCTICNKPFVKRTSRAICSRECELEHGRRYAKEHFISAAVTEERKCVNCGDAYTSKTVNTRFCSDRCNNAHIRKTVGNKYRKKAKYYGVEYEPVNKLKVFERDGWRCQICGKRTPRNRKGQITSNAPELDHRIPLSKGGGHTYENTQCACRACNGAKSNKAETGQMPLLGHRGTGGESIFKNQTR